MTLFNDLHALSQQYPTLAAVLAEYDNDAPQPPPSDPATIELNSLQKVMTGGGLVYGTVSKITPCLNITEASAPHPYSKVVVEITLPNPGYPD